VPHFVSTVKGRWLEKFHAPDEELFLVASKGEITKQVYKKKKSRHNPQKKVPPPTEGPVIKETNIPRILQEVAEISLLSLTMGDAHGWSKNPFRISDAGGAAGEEHKTDKKTSVLPGAKRSRRVGRWLFTKMATIPSREVRREEIAPKEKKDGKRPRDRLP